MHQMVHKYAYAEESLIFLFLCTGSQILPTYGTEQSSSRPIAVDYVRCQGSENSVAECTYFSYSFSGCSHDDDVGVRCQPG